MSTQSISPTSSSRSIGKTSLLNCVVAVVSALLSPVLDAQDTEPNDNVAQAVMIGALAPSASISGNLQPTGDVVDYYSFELPEDGTLLVTASSSGPPNWYPWIIASNSYGGDWINALVFNGSNSWTLSSLQAGIYYIRMQFAQCCYSIDYSIALTLVPPMIDGDPLPDDSLLNNPLPLSQDILANDSLTGHIYYMYSPEPADNYDYFLFHTDSVGDLAVHLQLVMSGVDLVEPQPTLELLDSALSPPANQLAVADGSIYSLSLNYNDLDSGTYYLWLRQAAVGCAYYMTTKHYQKHMELYNLQPTGDNTYLTYSSPTTTRAFKVCADGSDASELRFVCDNCGDMNNLRMRVASDQNGADPSRYGLFDPLHTYAVGNTLIARFTHPEFVDIPLPFRLDAIEVYDINTEHVYFQNPLEVYRAPVLFVHGGASDDDSFEDMAADLVNQNLYPIDGGFYDGAHLLRRLDYESTNASSFAVNRDKVPFNINVLKTEAIVHGYSCDKVIVVAHSMGGLLTRLYLQEKMRLHYRGDIQKLITLNTPHYGTQAANWAINGGVRADIVLALAFATNYLNELGAVYDLRVNSYPIRHLINRDQPTWNCVPSATLSTDEYFDLDPRAVAVRLVLPNIYDGEVSDLVVPLSSQQANLVSWPPITNQWHVGSQNNTELQERVRDLINLPPSSTEFAQTGFPTGILEYVSAPMVGLHGEGGDRDASIDTISIVAPLSGASFTPGSTVAVTLQSTSGVERIALIAFGASMAPITIDTTNVSMLEITLPPDALGTITLYVLGGDSTGWFAEDESYITVLPSVAPDSIQCYPDSVMLPLGLSQAFEATGSFPGIGVVDLSGAAGLTVQLDTFYLEQIGPEVFKALAVGATSIVFEYMGVTDTVLISIVDDPSALTAAFDYPAEPVCQGAAVNFSDISLGLTTGFEWSFPGGTPSSSTDAHPIITYASPGVYDVSLITTFVNGTDTLVLDSLVTVTAVDTSVTLAGATLTATAADGTYQWLDCGNGNAVISGETGQSYTPSSNGLYALSITQGACTDTSACYLVLTTSVPHVHEPGDALIIPNPNDGSFAVQLDGIEPNLLVEITDMTGRSIVRGSAQNIKRLELHLDGSPGLYLLTITTDSNRQVLSLVKR